jgi:hypothetical protein
LAETPPAERAAQEGEHRAVVDDAVHQDDRRTGCLDVADEEPALHGGQVGEPGALEDVLRALLEQAEGPHGQVRRPPGDLDGGPADPAGAGQGAAGVAGLLARLVEGAGDALELARDAVGVRAGGLEVRHPVRVVLVRR